MTDRAHQEPEKRSLSLVLLYVFSIRIDQAISDHRLIEPTYAYKIAHSIVFSFNKRLHDSNQALNPVSRSSHEQNMDLNLREVHLEDSDKYDS